MKKEQKTENKQINESISECKMQTSPALYHQAMRKPKGGGGHHRVRLTLKAAGRSRCSFHLMLCPSDWTLVWLAVKFIPGVQIVKFQAILRKTCT
jgi:hypothetical protein